MTADASSSVNAPSSRWLASAVVIFGLLMSSCAAPADNAPSAPVQPSLPSPPSGFATYPSLAEAEWDTFSRASIWMADPPAGLAPSVSHAEALSAVNSNGLNSDLMLGPPDAALKVVTNDLLRGAENEEGLTGGFYNRLAWVFLYHSSHPVAEEVGLTPEDCILLVTVDAADAVVLTIDQSCGGPVDISYSPPRPTMTEIPTTK